MHGTEQPTGIEFMFRGQHHNITPGIYFDMEEDLYHAIPCLSSTALKNVLISAPDFYANSWMNPFREEDAEDEDSSEWRVFGKAVHKRILEGKDVFDQHYCQKFIPPEGCLKTKEDLKEALTALGVPSKSSDAKPALIKLLKHHNPNAMIYDESEEKYFRENGGKIQLDQKQMRRIEFTAAMIEKHPALRYIFTGGYAEVSVVWFEDDCWFKARIDYLKPKAATDLKTFTNKRHKPIDMALHEEMASRKYHIQCALYLRACDWARKFAAEGAVSKTSRINPEQLTTFLSALAESPGHEFFNCFYKKGGAPMARGKKFLTNSNAYQCAVASITEAVARYKKYLQMYGTGIWVDDEVITDFEDEQFPVWMTEI